MSRTAVAVIDLQALRDNFSRIRACTGSSRIMCVVKANAYGHGLEEVAAAVEAADAYAVSCIEEAVSLRKIDTCKPICVFQGFMDAHDLGLCLKYKLEPVIHQDWQLALLESAAQPGQFNAWLKFTSGMNRLGFRLENALLLWNQLRHHPNIYTLGLMTHMACADEMIAGEQDFTHTQLRLFNEATAGLNCIRSVANSAALLALPEAHFDWVRPGIMLYGANPFSGHTGAEIGLKPVMTLKTQLIAINHCKKGDVIGYGGQWTCTQDTVVGVAAIGYGDGYPRSIRDKTPVLVAGQKVPVIGRVSMDMLTIDLSDIPLPQIGAEVVLWGQGLPVETIAAAADTIPYELLCSVYGQVHYEYLGRK